MAGRRFGFALFLALVTLTTTRAQLTEEEAESIETPKTEGLVGLIETSMWPISKLLLMYVDSVLRNLYSVELPCTVTSVAPWEAHCTEVE